MRNILALFVILFFVFESVSAKTYNIDTSTTSLDVKKGDKIVLQLKETPSTGYMWKIFNINKAILEEKSKKYIAPSSKMMGASGATKYVIRAIDIGNGEIRAYYYRPWEKCPVKPTYELNINVK